MLEYEVGLDEIEVVVRKLLNIVGSKDCVVLLQGDLASGKTTFVKSYVKEVGLDDLVTSPTFSLQSVYGARVYHYDIYNKTLEEFISLGLLEEFEKCGVHFVEWGDSKLQKLLVSYGFEVLSIEIEKCDNKRRYKINA